MARLGSAGLFYYIGGVFLLVGLYALWRMTQRAAPPLAEQAKFVPTPGSTHVAGELNRWLRLLPKSNLSHRLSAFKFVLIEAQARQHSAHPELVRRCRMKNLRVP